MRLLQLNITLSGGIRRTIPQASRPILVWPKELNQSDNKETCQSLLSQPNTQCHVRAISTWPPKCHRRQRGQHVNAAGLPGRHQLKHVTIKKTKDKDGTRKAEGGAQRPKYH